MKRILFIITCILLLTLFVSCNNKPAESAITAHEGDYTINGKPEQNTWNKAFNMLQDNGTIDINSGTYTISNPVTSGAKNVLIEGDDTQNPTIIKCDALAFLVGNNNWIFRNLTIETTETYGVGIETFNNKNVFMQNVTINGVLYNGDYHVGDLR